MYIFAIEGLRYLWESGQGERAFAIAVCLTVIVTSATGKSASGTYCTRYAVPDARTVVLRQLQGSSGRYLALVTYDLARHYPGNELVHNGADFDSARILWARSKGPDADAKLCSAYSDRKFVSVSTDDMNISVKPLDICK